MRVCLEPLVMPLHGSAALLPGFIDFAILGRYDRVIECVLPGINNYTAVPSTLNLTDSRLAALPSMLIRAAHLFRGRRIAPDPQLHGLRQTLLHGEL